MYVTAREKATFAVAFDMSKVPVVSYEQALAEERTKKLTSATPTLKAPSTGPKKAQANGSAEGAASGLAATQQHSQELMQVPELREHGAVLRSSSVIELTESETEYVVTAIKHIFKEHIVLQYEIKNTLADTVLEEVSVVATPSEEDEELEEEFIIPVAKLETNVPGIVYVSFKKIGDSPYPITSFTNVLRFTSKEIDPTTGEPDEGGYEDKYEVEDLELVGSDYVVPAFAGSFDHVWEQTGAHGEEASETLQLASTKSISGKSPNSLSFILQKTKPNDCYRCNRTAHQNPLSPTTRRYRRGTLRQHPHTKTLRQNALRRQGRFDRENGVFGQEWRHYENHRTQRRERRCEPGPW